MSAPALPPESETPGGEPASPAGRSAEETAQPTPPGSRGADLRSRLQSRLPSRLRVQGLPAGAVALLGLVLTFLGATVDGLTSGSLGAGFVSAYVLACLLGALLIRGSELSWALILPPLVFAAAIVLSAPVIPGGSGGDVKQQAIELGTSLSLRAPHLFAGLLVALVVVAVRRFRH